MKRKETKNKREREAKSNDYVTVAQQQPELRPLLAARSPSPTGPRPSPLATPPAHSAVGRPGDTIITDSANPRANLSPAE